MFKAWKKEVWPGSKPVGPAGTHTSSGAKEPDLAAAGTLLVNTNFRTSLKLPLVNTKPILPYTNGNKFSNSGRVANFSRITLRIKVFFSH